MPATGWYDVYAYQVTGGALTDQARYTIYSEGDSVSILLDQQNSYNAGWQHLETVYLESGVQSVLTVDNSLLTGSEKLAADAAMLMLNRKYSPDVVITNLSKPGDSRLPPHFALSPNYPNPFNSDTRITYTLPVGGVVKIQIINIRGKVIGSTQKAYSTGGTHSWMFSKDNLSSGVYFYIVQYFPTGTGTEIVRKSGKMTLLK